jgi:excisionase family DNA binding protein
VRSATASVLCNALGIAGRPFPQVRAACRRASFLARCLCGRLSTLAVSRRLNRWRRCGSLIDSVGGGRDLTTAERKMIMPRLTVTSEVVPVLYRVDEAAAALRLSRSSVYELIRSGQLRTVKQGRRRLVPVTALAEYVASLGGTA